MIYDTLASPTVDIIEKLTLHCTGSEITGFVQGEGAFWRHLVEDVSRGHFLGQIH